ncbi:hypothetical protein Tco_0747196 [Tanacetum coccineum]
MKQILQRLQSKEQEKYTIKEKARMLAEMITERKKFFAAQRAAKIRSRPPIKDAFVPKDSEIEKEVMKRPGFDFQQKSIKKNDKVKALGFVQKKPAEEEKEKKIDDSQQQARSSKKRSREDSDEDNVKKQKLEDDAEKEELRDGMDVVPRDDIAIDVESLATKYPIVDWKTMF